MHCAWKRAFLTWRLSPGRQAGPGLGTDCTPLRQLSWRYKAWAWGSPVGGGTPTFPGLSSGHPGASPGYSQHPGPRVPGAGAACGGLLPAPSLQSEEGERGRMEEGGEVGLDRKSKDQFSPHLPQKAPPSWAPRGGPHSSPNSRKAMGTAMGGSHSGRTPRQHPMAPDQP